MANLALDGIKANLSQFENTKKLSESATTVLACFREFPEIRLTTAIIAKETQLPRRTIVYALSQLVSFNLIQKYGQGAGVRYQLIF
ncbi:MAG: hypothetical protein JKY15_04705 [Deltaproteobacteria bacterium]|nr:hypothetical protein [Deltaproteobacteria bacterium]